MTLDQDFNQFTLLFKKRTGINLALYKENQMKRRLSSLKERKGFRTFIDFYHALDKNERLLHELLEHMTINVSEFYRNAQRWEVLEKHVIPDILTRNRRPKCWSAACSTGEEPYSLALLLTAYLDPKEISILATDIDNSVIEKAKSGIYGAEAVRDVPKPYLNRYFASVSGRYAISEEIKRCVRFKPHNLLADSYEKGLDLIICRNVLIYFTDEAKESLFEKFSQSLRKGGYLFIGGSEQIFQPQRYELEPVDTFFYRKQ
ncbi:protein-glutamate O-methyltransferase CheR [Paenibacillus oenotherae]|uniref:protein-glutamate O-methyltransferase n=2 Tax=Paenibacillus oenotherae TaxID=1435645 RepID=A0ABS7D2X0_9BACL|nr:protein-glutamate O-methyltransferase CheR [Paenibacillus oenotherae]